MTSAPLLSVRDLRTWFPIRRGVLARRVGYVKAVDGVSLDIMPGETVGLVGESGCGKTTLARTVMRLDPAHDGSVCFQGKDLLTCSATTTRALRRELQIIFQDPFSSLNPRMTVMEIITEGMLEHGLIAGRDKRDAAQTLLDEVGLGSHALHRYPHEFSGGQRQRISIARAVSLRPRLVVCDEAVSALDVSVQAQIINLLGDLRAQHGLAYLFISHDLSVVRHIADRVAVMYLGRLVELGATADVIDRPRHPYTRALVSAIPRVGGSTVERTVLQGDVPSPARPPAGCRFHTRCPHATDRCRTEDPVLRTVKADVPGRTVACHLAEELG